MIGIAALHPANESFFNALERADRALYQAKFNGRNRIEVESDEIFASEADTGYSHCRRIEQVHA